MSDDIIESYLESPSKKSGDLVEAYRIALDPRQWREDRREMLEKSRTAAVEYAKGYMDSKKARMPASRVLDSAERFRTGDVVLGKVGGYLTWPGWVRFCIVFLTFLFHVITHP